MYKTSLAYSIGAIIIFPNNLLQKITIISTLAHYHCKSRRKCREQRHNPPRHIFQCRLRNRRPKNQNANFSYCMKWWISSRSYIRKDEKGSAEFVSKGTFSNPQNLSFDCVSQGSKIYIWTSSPNNQEAMFESLGNEGFFSSLKQYFQ